MTIQFVKKLHILIKNELSNNISPQKLALSFCVGNYIAFSPYIFFHTAMAFLFSWLFALNLPVTLAASCVINNIWTMVPIYMADYWFGHWLCYGITNIGSIFGSMSWLENMQILIKHKTGINLPCLMSFLIGGNLLGLLISCIAYWPVKKLFNCFVKNHESISSKS